MIMLIFKNEINNYDRNQFNKKFEVNDNSYQDGGFLDNNDLIEMVNSI